MVVIARCIDVSLYVFDIDEKFAFVLNHLLHSVLFPYCCWLLVVGCWLLVVGCWLFGRSRVADEEEFEDGEEGGLDYLMQR